jgi:hypothetical protein
MVADYNRYTKDPFIGELVLNLENFFDQTKHDNWYRLINKSGAITGAEIRLEIQLIYSRVGIYYFINNLIKIFFLLSS